MYTNVATNSTGGGGDDGDDDDGDDGGLSAGEIVSIVVPIGFLFIGSGGVFGLVIKLRKWYLKRKGAVDDPSPNGNGNCFYN